MYEALCRPFGTTLDTIHDESGPQITQRTRGLKSRPFLPLLLLLASD
jgi:hypothetical protein